MYDLILTMLSLLIAFHFDHIGLDYELLILNDCFSTPKPHDNQVGIIKGQWMKVAK